MAQLGSKKSRKGCRRCKQRRVKCDELAPCNNCVRRNEECSLLEPTPSASSTQENTADAGIPANSEEWVQDLELMHHYSTAITKDDFGIGGRHHHIWRHYIPQQALKHTFLMHGILALSALHAAWESPDEAARYLQLCDKHQTIALKRFRTILSSEFDPELADTLFAVASVISVSSMARSCAVAEVGPSEKAVNMDDVTELFFLTRGVRDVIFLAYDHIKQSPMGAMFEGHNNPASEALILPQPVADQFVALRQLIDNWDLDPEALTHCQSALIDLEEIYRNVMYQGSVANVDTGLVWRWTTMITTGYVRLIQTRNPPALIIFAYFAAATMAVRTAWYTQNWGVYAVRGVQLKLDPTMQHWTEWPMQQTEARMAALGIVLSERGDSPPKPIVGW